MKIKAMRNFVVFYLFLLFPILNLYAQNKEVHIDKDGIIRWNDNSEVALFGANYCLPSASDYRAAGYVSSDRKKMIDDDLTHFARMEWDALRLSFWGDFENSDKDGNLINNDHLDLLDYIVYKCSERGIYILLSPIVTYDSKWPDGKNDIANGFSTVYRKNELGTNPDAIKAQQNYIRQLLTHVNPYSGIALKDEPNIIFIEMINEPTHHSDDFDGSVAYINALVEAVRSTGCKKPTFHNVTQDMKIAPAVKASEVDGVTIGWYPMGLVGGHALTNNNLRAVDDFTPMHTPILKGMPRIVYEFDEADCNTPYMYPAMVRAFRGIGVQFAVMFSYDMLATSPYNLGWQTHLMNMVYYPQKAVGSIISSHLMKTLPLYKSYGQYPENTTFGSCRISYESNLSEFNTPERFIYANNTATKPVDESKLQHIVGYGSSPLVEYEGKGVYFIDKINEGTYRLEVYPDALIVSEPFAPINKDKIVSRLISRHWSMSVNLKGLGAKFNVMPLNENNTYQTFAVDGKFDIQPGVYLLSANKNIDINKMPTKIGQIGLREFVCPSDTHVSNQVISEGIQTYVEGNEIVIRAKVQTMNPPSGVDLFYRKLKNPKWFIKEPMKAIDAYTWEARIPSSKIGIGYYKYCITVKMDSISITYPDGHQLHPWDWNFDAPNQWDFVVVNKKAPIRLLSPADDCTKLAFTRIGDGGRTGVFDIIPAADGVLDALRLYFPVETDSTIDDYTVSVLVKDQLSTLNLDGVNAVNLRVSGDLKGTTAYVTLMEVDGTSWSVPIDVEDQWREISIPLSTFKIGKGVLLPLGFPDRWNYWVSPAQGRGGENDKIDVAKIERVQISIRPNGSALPTKNPWLDISEITLNN